MWESWVRPQVMGKLGATPGQPGQPGPLTRALAPCYAPSVLRFVLIALAMSLAGCPESPSSRPTDAAFDRYIFNFPEAGDLVAPDSAPALTDRCLGAQPIGLASGKASVKGDTTGAQNEFGALVRCGEQVAMAGPQRYYWLSMEKQRVYRLELKPTFDAVLYLFSECSQTLINVDCASGGATGIYSGVIAAQGQGGITFVPPASGNYRVAVDSLDPAQAGAFQLEVQEWTAPAHASCGGAKPLTMTGGSATVNDSTLGATDDGGQLTCGLQATLDGPQLYYAVELEASSWYRITLQPQFTATLLVASAAGGCVAANLETDCSGIGGTVLPLVPQGGEGATAFHPPVSGTYIVAVDSPDAAQAGAFDLEVQTFTPPSAMVCEGAQALPLVAGQATASGDTTALLNDRGALMSCGVAPLVGPQTYYQLALQAKTYELRLSPSFPAVLAVGTSCLMLPADCAAGGLVGDALAVAQGTVGTLLFTPGSAGTYHVSVEGQSATAEGPFTLQVVEYVKPVNGSCATPQLLALAQSPAEALGDTGPLSNDLVGVSCGDPVGPWPGPQAYHRVSLEGGVSYSITLVPEATFDPALYAFPAATACTATDVNAACTGLSSDAVGAGVPESLTLTPAVDTDYILVVDAWSPSEVGTYALRVTWP